MAHTWQWYFPTSSSVTLGMMRVLVTIPWDVVSVVLCLWGSVPGCLCQVIIWWPLLITEHVNTPLNGAAALVLVGWVTNFDGKTTKANESICAM